MSGIYKGDGWQKRKIIKMKVLYKSPGRARAFDAKPTITHNPSFRWTSHCLHSII